MTLLVVGLGNPGERYESSRHNVGFMTVRLIADRYAIRLTKPWFRPFRVGETRVSGERLVVAQPLTYMNRSGEALPALLNRCAVGTESLVVVCDTLDLPVGACRIKSGGGSAGHHGLESIASVLGTSSFARIYVGIGRPNGGEVVDHVLGDFSDGERRLVEQAIERAAQSAVALLSSPIAKVMNDLNQRRTPAPPQG